MEKKSTPVPLTLMRVVQALCLSCFGVVSSLIIALAFVYFVPQKVSTVQPVHKQLDQSYTAKEMEDHQRRMQADLDSRVEAREKETFVDGINGIKKEGAIISWLPWLFIGWIFKKLTSVDFLVLLSIPFLIAFVGNGWLGEVPIFASAILIGVLFRKGWRNAE